MEPHAYNKAPCPVPLTEFTQRRELFKKATGKWSLAFMLVIIVGIVLIVVTPRTSRATAAVNHDAMLKLGIIAGISCLCWVLAWIFYKYRGSQARKFNLICPCCRQHLHLYGFLHLAMHTGHCGNCGTRLISDHSYTKPPKKPASKNSLVRSFHLSYHLPFLKYPDSSLPVTLKEFTKRRDQFDKAMKRWSPLIAIVFVSLIVLPAVVVNRWTSIFNDMPLGQKVLEIGIIVVCVLTLIIGLLTSADFYKKVGLICPSCKRDIRSHFMPLIIATGHCNKCGEQLISDHPSQQRNAISTD